MNTRQYYYLTTIAEYGNLTYAAEALNVTPSALSKFLTECGQIFGTTLFQRRDRRLEPTGEGQYVVECAQKDFGPAEQDASDNEKCDRQQPEENSSGYSAKPGGHDIQ